MTTINAQLGNSEAVSSEIRPARVLDVLMSTMQVADSQLAPIVGVSRQTIHHRRKGRRSMTLHDIDTMAKALDVPPELFLGTPADAVRFLLEHRPNYFEYKAA